MERRCTLTVDGSHWQEKPGFILSRPRMFMFGMTTFMFTLGIIALVLTTAVEYQYIKAIPVANRGLQFPAPQRYGQRSHA